MKSSLKRRPVTSCRLLAVAAFAVLAGACTTTERTVVVPSSSPAVTAADDSCTFYGYTPGTDAYNVCIEREAAARRRGRMAADYARARIVADSQDACVSYGLARGTDSYDRCVQREINYRRPV